MKTEIAAKLMLVVDAVKAGTDLAEAFEAQFGAGSFEKLAGMLHDELSAAERRADMAQTERELRHLVAAAEGVASSLSARITADNAMTPQATMVRQLQDAIRDAKAVLR